MEYVLLVVPACLSCSGVLIDREIMQICVRVVDYPTIPYVAGLSLAAGSAILPWVFC